MTRRWNGWGDGSYVKEVSTNGRKLIQSKIGQTKALVDATLESVVAKVPESRLPENALIDTDKEQRVRHARGQSFPDWLAMRSGEFGVFPDGVAFPETSEQVRELLDLSVKEDFIVIPYGGGTSVTGHITPDKSAKPILTIDMTRMDQLLDLDKESQIATFGAGTPGPLVESQLRAKGYTLGHYPQSWELSTLGGWVASRSSGQQSLRYGRIEQMFAGGQIETLEGTLSIPAIPASSAGPDLREICMGTEGRLGIFTEVKVRVRALAEQEQFKVYFLPNWDIAKKAVKHCVQSDIPLSMMRLSNAKETHAHLNLGTNENQYKWLTRFLSLRGLGDGKCMMTFGVTGTKGQNKHALKQLKKVMKAHGAVGGVLANMMGNIWAEGRFKFPYLRETMWAEGIAIDTMETSVNWNQTDALINDIEQFLEGALSDKKEQVMAFTHLSHLYQQGSSIYVTFFFRCMPTYQETFENWQVLKQGVCMILNEHGATVSHQHGVGKDHAPYLLKEKSPLGMRLISTMLNDFDPEQRLNPNVLIEDTSAHLKNNS